MKHKFKPVQTQLDFPALEKEILANWYSSGLVYKYLHKNDKSKTTFSFVDGPITANNPMGVHHGWGRTYKDLWQRYHNMKGDRQRFQNGFDCQGLWVEVEVEKELGFRSKKDIEVYGVANFVNKCKERVLKYSAIQTEQTKRLGNFMDWDNSYFTMADENNYMIWYFLKICWERGWIYKGHDSVPWCPRCETAISQHEMLTEDYKEMVHDSIYLELPIEGRIGEYLLIWTTTPWTIPANIAVTVDKNLDYALVERATGDRFWVAKELVEAVFKKDYKAIVKIVKGKELVGLKYRGPFDHLESVKKVAGENSDKFHIVIATDPQILPIGITEGTGLVHTAVSAGAEDFQLGKKYGLPMIPVIADNADYLPGLGEFSGKNAKKNPNIILDYLKGRDEVGENWVFKIIAYKHRYPACWRCKTELVWKVADEWYISMDRIDPGDKQNRTLRQQLVDVTKKVRWMPEFGLDRELDWLKNMHDWLISKKNRYWGLALPIYECKKCGYFQVVGSREELQKRAVKGWEKFEGNSPHKPWIDEVKIKCTQCNETVSRILDVGNPWLDAGIVPFSTLKYTTDKEYWKQWFPAEFITESFPGQFKNWFYSLLVMSTVLEKTNPFETVLGFASLLAEDGRSMHKSWGNAIEFNQGADKMGVDVMRWLYVSHNPAENLLFGYKKADEVRRQFFLILWNVYNFFVLNANLDGWKSESKKVSKSILDKWILARLDETLRESTSGLDQYKPDIVAASIEKFVSDLSTWYIRRSRDRVGPTAEDSDDKNAFYSTSWQVLTTVCKLMAPFTPFISDEIYRNLTGEESVHLADWPSSAKATAGEALLLENMNMVRKICELGNAKRKELGIKVRQPLARLSIQYSVSSQPAGEAGIQDKELIQLIKDELNVKNVEFVNGDGELVVELDRNITQELEQEGKARDLIREIQGARKEAQTTLDEKVIVYLPSWPKAWEEEIKRQTLSEKLINGDKLKIEKL